MLDQIYHVWIVNTEGKVVEFLGSRDRLDREHTLRFIVNEYIKFRCPIGTNLIVQQFRPKHPALQLQVIGFSYDAHKPEPRMLVKKLKELPRETVSEFTQEWTFSHRIAHVFRSRYQPQQAIRIAENLAKYHLAKPTSLILKLFGM